MHCFALTACRSLDWVRSNGDADLQFAFSGLPSLVRHAASLRSSCLATVLVKVAPRPPRRCPYTVALLRNQSDAPGSPCATSWSPGPCSGVVPVVWKRDVLLTRRRVAGLSLGPAFGCRNARSCQVEAFAPRVVLSCTKCSLATLGAAARRSYMDGTH